MTARACRGPRALLMDAALRELDPLKQQRVDSHVARCDECRLLLARYTSAFGAAQTWDPDVEPEDLDRMVERLTPYLEAERPRRGALWYGVGAAGLAAAAAAAFVVLSTPAPLEDRPSAPAIVEAVNPSFTPPVVVAHKRPTPHLRVVSSEDWNGEVEAKSETLTRVKMSSGFAVMSFEGGQGRRLVIAAPDVTVEVIGTRFYVEAKPDAPTVVGVVSGKVRVRSNGTESIVGAGEAQAFDAHGKQAVKAVRSSAHHADTFLEYDPAPREPKTVEKKPRRRSAAKKAVRPERDAMADILEAEQLTRDGRYADAATVYSTALEDRSGGALAKVMRFERARLWAFHLGRVDDARASLMTLATTQGEVSVQAKLTLCELVRTSEPCRSKRCLESLSDDGIAEAERTVSRWGLDRFDCVDHKRTPR